MNVAKFPFAVLQYFGAWQPKSWTSQWATYFYGLYSLLIITGLLTFSASFLIYILRFSEDISSLTESLLMFCTSCAVIIKMLNIIVHHDKIIAIDNMLSENICIPRDPEEAFIQNEYENLDRMQTTSLLTFCFSFAMYISLSPLFSSTKFALPIMSAWFPFSMESRLLYWLAYFYQTLVLLILNLITCSIDLYVVMIMKRISTQLEIFKHRLHVLPKLLKENHQEVVGSRRELKIMEDWIFYHTHLYTMGEKLNDVFSLMIFVQFFVSTSALTIIIYHLVKVKLFSRHFWFIFGCLGDFIFEIFFYCWYGEEMICKSTEIANSVYEMDWNLLPINFRKCLIIIVMRARKPIELVGGSWVTMSADTLVMILKAAYSAFSVLKTSSDRVTN